MSGDDVPWAANNRAWWDERTPIHSESDFYDLEGFLADPTATHLRPFDLDEVGDVAGKTLVHPQCHFGLDTLSWARRGARVTGLDFSAPAIETARAAAARLGIDADFARSTSSTPGWGPSRGCPTSAVGPRSWPPSPRRVASSTWPSSTRCTTCSVTTT
jgi:hypothetical protein